MYIYSTKSSSAISDINIEHLEIDGNKTGNISIPATCTINYTDNLMLSVEILLHYMIKTEQQ